MRETIASWFAPTDADPSAHRLGDGEPQPRHDAPYAPAQVSALNARIRGSAAPLARRKVRYEEGQPIRRPPRLRTDQQAQEGLPERNHGKGGPRIVEWETSSSPRGLAGTRRHRVKIIRRRTFLAM